MPSRAQQILNDPVRTPYEQLMFELPAQVVAMLCGLDPAAGGEASRLVGRFVQCIPATASPEQQQRAARAAAGLQELLGPKLDDTQQGLLGDLVRMATQVNWTDRAPLLANGIGFLSQTYDATAALMGNTLLALSQQERERPADETTLERFVREVIRHDAPVQNTRRFTATPIRHGDVEVPAGQAILVLLAAANRDPAANPNPHTFRADRTAPTVFTFSAGAHRCPGEMLAVTVVTTVVEQLLKVGFDPASLSTQVTYRPSPNTRIPVLTDQAGT